MGKYLADGDRITQRLQLCLESKELLCVGITDVPAEQRLGTERDRVDDIFGERVFTEDLEEIVLAGAPHGLLLRVITVPDDAKNSPVISVSFSVVENNMDLGILQIILGCSLNNVVPDRCLFANWSINSDHDRTVVGHYSKVLA